MGHTIKTTISEQPERRTEEGSEVVCLSVSRTYGPDICVKDAGPMVVAAEIQKGKRKQNRNVSNDKYAFRGRS